VGGCGGGVSVGCEIVQFRGSVMGALWHVSLPACSMQSPRRGFAL
jgi:hypothetical protein